MLGEPSVQFIGDPKQIVSRVGIGTGCGCHLDVYGELGCDIAVTCDDAHCYFSHIPAAADTDMPVIRVNHGTSEEPGMVTLTQYINEHLDGVEAEHLSQGCQYLPISGDNTFGDPPVLTESVCNRDESA